MVRTQTISSPHYDIVGSFLRPAALKEGRQAFADGEISAADLLTIEDKEITALVQKQKDAGLKIISDGELRRSYWHLDFFWGLTGIDHVYLDEGYLFHDEETRADSARVSDKIAFNPDHPVFSAFTFLQSLTDSETAARQSIPAPAQLYAELIRGENADYLEKIYPNQEELFADITEAYHKTILKLYDLGLRHLKFDDCSWGMLVDEDFVESIKLSADNIEDIKRTYLNLNNAALANLPDDLELATHICRGNYHSTWAFQGGYEKVADVLFAEEEVTRFFLEFDDQRSGDFAPLRFIPEGTQVVLGLVTSKKPELEDKAVIKKRIYEAAEYVPLELLSLSPQCGFASTEEGNQLTEADQWKKLALVKEVAEEVWG